MSVLTMPPPLVPQVRTVTYLKPRPYRWTCSQFHQMGELGIFEGLNVILINGEILEMPGPNPPHTTSKSLTVEALRTAFGKGFLVREQDPLVLGRTTDPIPDVAVVKGAIRDYATLHPSNALLVVEVSDSCLDYDVGDKSCLYASVGIPDYWVVDLPNRQLHVFRDPQADSTKPFDFTYSNVTTYLPGQSVSPLALPTATVAVAELLP